MIALCSSILFLIITLSFYFREKRLYKKAQQKTENDIKIIENNLSYYSVQVTRLAQDLLDFYKFDQDRRTRSIVTVNEVISSIEEILEKLDDTISQAMFDKNTMGTKRLMRAENKFFYLKLNAHRLHGEMNEVLLRDKNFVVSGK